jgi:hypothetical protein
MFHDQVSQFDRMSRVGVETNSLDDFLLVSKTAILANVMLVFADILSFLDSTAEGATGGIMDFNQNFHADRA